MLFIIKCTLIFYKTLKQLKFNRNSIHKTLQISVIFSAGIGRTGVLITMETAMCLIECNQPVYPLDIVRTMRDQRAMMIQTPVSTIFLCLCSFCIWDSQPAMLSGYSLLFIQELLLEWQGGPYQIPKTKRRLSHVQRKCPIFTSTPIPIFVSFINSWSNHPVSGLANTV